MPHVKTICDRSEIYKHKHWLPAQKFHSQNRLVDKNGNKIDANYEGRRYLIIEKREYRFSKPERIGRGLVGTIAVICTLGLALFFISDLFTKSKKSIRYAEEQTPFKIKNGKITYSNLESKLVFGEVEISDGKVLNFATIKTGGKQKLVPVVYDRFGKEYEGYEGSDLEALFKLAQYEGQRHSLDTRLYYGSPIPYFLNHYCNLSITQEEFIRFIFEKDEEGTRRINSLSQEKIREVFVIAKKANISLDETDDTLNGLMNELPVVFKL